MKNKKFSLLLLLFTTILIVLSACGGDGEEGSESSSDSESIKISILSDFSGPGASIGPGAENAAELAVSEINAAGGVLDKEVELLVGDSGSDAETANEQAKTMYERNNVEALFLTSNSANREAVMPIAEKSNKLFFYTPVYEGGSFHENAYFSGDVPSQQIEPVVPHLIEEYDANSWYIVANDYIWATETSDILKNILEQEGAELVGEDYVPLGTTEFTSIISKIKEEKPDFISMQLHGADAVSFVKQIDSLGLNEDVTIYGYLNDEDSIKAMGKGAVGLLQSASYFHNLDTPENNDYLEKYYDKFGEDATSPNFISNSSYEAIHIWAQTVNEADSLETDALNEVIPEISFDGPKGTVKFDRDNHHAELSIHLAEVQEDFEYEIIKEFGIISPGNE